MCMDYGGVDHLNGRLGLCVAAQVEVRVCGLGLLWLNGGPVCEA